MSTAVPVAQASKKSPVIAKAKRLAPKAPLATPSAGPARSPRDRTVANGSIEKKENEFDSPKPPGLSTLRKLNKRRQDKRTTVMSLVTAGGLCVTIVTLSILLYRQVNPPLATTQTSDFPDEITAPFEKTPARLDDAGNPFSAQPTQNRSARSNGNGPATAKPDPSPPPKIRLADLPPRKFEYLKKSRVAKCWETVRPQLVSLTVHDAQGSHPAIATLIDSRGWIVTSFQAVVGASRIDVSSSAKSIDELPDANLLTDLVRGVIAVDPEHDLAILSVNRRFVVSFAEMKTDAKDHLVEGQYLLLSSPPSPENPFGQTESKIVSRTTFDKLPASARSQASRLGLVDPENTWLVSKYQARPLPGTPMIMIDGTLGAINVFSENDRAYSLSVAHVNELSAQAKDMAQPLSLLADASQPESTTAVRADHPMRETSVRLNRFGEVCEAFDWMPNDESEYKSLQTFASLTTQAVRYTIENRDVRTEREQVQKFDDQVKHWEKSLSQTLGAADSDREANLAKMNVFAKSELGNTGQYVPFYGKILHAGFEIPDFILLEFDGQPVVVNIPHDPAAAPMLPDSKWIFFVKTPARRKFVKFNVTGKTVTAQSVELQFAIGPMR